MMSSARTKKNDGQNFWKTGTNRSGFTIIEFIIAWFALAAAFSALMTFASIRFKKLNYEKRILAATELRLRFATLLTDEMAWQATFIDPNNSTGSGSFSCLPATSSCDSGGEFRVIDGAGNVFFDPDDSSNNGFSESAQLCAYPTDGCLFTYNLSWERVTDLLIRVTVRFEKNPNLSFSMNPQQYSLVVYKYIGP